MPLDSLREEHLAEGELIAFSRQVLSPEERDESRAHLDLCKGCRDRLELLHKEDDGTGSTKLSDPLLGRMLGEYQVEQALSRGGMGAVYKGRQPVIGKKVAIKVLLPDVAGNANQMHRLLEEARAVNAIRHPNIIDIFSFGDLPDGRHYFVMELLEGQPLDELLMSKGRLTPSQVMTVLEQTMSALGAAHASGVIHRDLKPANLFVGTLPDQSWHVTVLDFGLAKRLGAASGTLPNVVMGTPGYMAPEQIRGEEVTARTDLYAMGVVAWVLLAGAEPFSAPSLMELLMRHLDTPVPPLPPLAPGCPPSLASLVTRLLEKRPEDRPQSAMEVLGELQRIRHERTSRPALLVNPPRVRPSAPRPPPKAAEPTMIIDRTAVPPPRPSPASDAEPKTGTTPNASRTPLLAAAGLLALGLLGAGAWWLTGRSPPRPIESPRDVRPGKSDPTPGNPLAVVDMPAKDPVAVVDTAAKDPVAVVDAPAKDPVAVVDGPSKDPVAVVDGPSTDPVAVVNAPVKDQPPVTSPKAPPQGATKGSVEKRLAAARTKAAELSSSAARRLMLNELIGLEQRLAAGDAPRAVNRDLNDLLEKYGAH